MRKYIDCREMGAGNGSKCTVAIAAERDDELMDAAVQHAISVHKEKDTPQLRKDIKDHMKSGSPPP
jgi:predicted small metal-binding protein